jgi:hypothetical protein
MPEERKDRQQAIENIQADNKVLEARLEELKRELRFVKSEIKDNNKNLANYGKKGAK